MAKAKKVPPGGAPMAGKNNPTSYRAMPPKGRSSASNQGGGRALRPASKSKRNK